MAFKKWVVALSDRELAKTLSEECDIDPFAVLIATARGYSDAGELEQFLSDEILISDPHELVDIIAAAECINHAIAAETKIAIFGDYDCDGVTATTLLYDYLSKRNANCIYYIPDRADEGYGMNKSAIDHLKSQNVELIITVDNGISSAKEIEYAYSLDMKVVVTDHHIPPGEIPVCEAVVDPWRSDCPSSFKQICGVEVAFKLVCVLDGKEPEELLDRYADLLAIGTVGDVMPLQFENRCIVKYGLRKLRVKPSVGAAAIMSVAGIGREDVNSGKISFGIVPRINAAGRMGKADRAVKLLSSTNMLEALEIANEIDAENNKRQQTEKEITAQAMELIEKNGYQHHRVIVVGGENWHPGIVGIVASKITEKYGRPAVILNIEGDIAGGSGRSYSGFSLYDAISHCKDLLLKFGGHELAAGLSIELDKLDDFRKMINDYAHSVDYVPQVLKLDCRLNPSVLSTDIAESIKILEPYGVGNPTPLFGLFAVTLQKITPIGGGKHLRLLFGKDNTSFQALLFGVTPDAFCFSEGDLLDIAVTLDTNLYQGNYTLSVQIKALRISGTDDEKLFLEYNHLSDYISGYAYDARLIAPSREDVGIVYKALLKAPLNCERVKYIFNAELGYGRAMTALKTLLELGLAEKSGNTYKAVNNGVKTELTNSKTYHTLLKEVSGSENGS